VLAINFLSATSSFACVIAPTPSTDAPSVQPVVMTFIEEAISNFKNHSATLKYQCTDAFFFTVSSTGVFTIGSTGAEGTFVQTFLELLCTSQSNLILHQRLLSIASFNRWY
jgi:hypothetical protein